MSKLESNDIISREMARGALLGGMAGTGYQSLAMGLVRMLPSLNAEDVMDAMWVSVKDRLPDKKGDYIVNCRHTYGGENPHVRNYVTIIHFRGKTKWATGNDCITHWMPKPFPPTED